MANLGTWGCWILAAVLSLALAPAPAAAQAVESPAGNPLVEITSQSTGDGHDGSASLVCRLTTCLEATITIEAALVNMEASHPLPYTFVARSPQPEVVLKLTPIRRGSPCRYSFTYTFYYGGMDGRHDRKAVYRLPYPLIKHYVVSQGNFGRRSHGEGSGEEYAVDWTMPEGSPVWAARGGQVIAVKQDSTQGGNDRQFIQASNLIIIKHDDGTCAEYCHLQKDGALVKLGQRVTAGTPIALSGNTGQSSGPHLHVGVYTNETGSGRTSLPVRWQTKHEIVERLIEGHTY